jgi:glycosyltransferase involved in cell wall biosynthesis
MAAYCAQQARDAWNEGAPLAARLARTCRALAGLAVLGTAERLIPGIVDTMGPASDDLRKRSLSWGCPAEDVFVVPAAADCNTFRPGLRDPELRKSLGLHGPTVLYFGSFDAHPELAFFADALRTLFREAPAAQCLVMGGGPGRERLRSFLRGVAPEGAVVMTDGLVPAEDVPRYVASCDITALPFRDTAVNRCKSSVTLVESMASGLVCVSHDVGDVAAMLGDAGVLAPAGDAEAFGNALARLALDGNLRRELGAAARRRACELFSPQATVDPLEAAYRRAIARRAPRS